MSQARVSQNYPDGEIDLLQLIATLWAGKWLIITITFLFAAGGVAYALTKPNIYQASVLMAPANQESNGVGAVSGQLGGLAGLAGISIGGTVTNKTFIAKEVLGSRAFLTDFIKRHNLGAPLMATEGWIMDESAWQYNLDVYKPSTGEWLPDENGQSQQPTAWDLVKTFKDNHLSVSENRETGLVTLSVKSLSPPAAQQWAEWLVKDLNEHMRREDVARAEARIAYLKKKLEETNVTGMRQVFYQLIENETRTVMLANAEQEYIFKIIDPAVIPQDKSEPNRPLIAVVATMLGGMIGVFSVILLSFIKSCKRPSTGEANK